VKTLDRRWRTFLTGARVSDRQEAVCGDALGRDCDVASDRRSARELTARRKNIHESSRGSDGGAAMNGAQLHGAKVRRVSVQKSRNRVACDGEAREWIILFVTQRTVPGRIRQNVEGLTVAPCAEQVSR